MRTVLWRMAVSAVLVFVMWFGSVTSVKTDRDRVPITQEAIEANRRARDACYARSVPSDCSRCSWSWRNGSCVLTQDRGDEPRRGGKISGTNRNCPRRQNQCNDDDDNRTGNRDDDASRAENGATSFYFADLEDLFWSSWWSR